ncbi:TRAP transporter small permease [Pseudaestuariivita sp.]|uniref:TRAP transporter small permease n=1 Tax=Pseudaestuariivita sp. TaxID=2211669 RepID=UPI0040597CC6
MPALFALLAPFQLFNDHVLRVGRWIAMVCIALMVVFILVQVFFRYVLNNALPWPDEAARFMMLWMTGLIAPSAYRRGGFVAIDMIERALPSVVNRLLTLTLLAIALAVLLVAVQHGNKHVTSGCLFKTSTLWLPFKFEFNVPLPFDLNLTLCTRQAWTFGLEWGWQKMPRAVVFASLYVGVILLIIVNIELMLRQIIGLFGGGDRLRSFEDASMQGAT